MHTYVKFIRIGFYKNPIAESLKAPVPKIFFMLEYLKSSNTDSEFSDSNLEDLNWAA